ncbi:hypothetical protein ABW20_dc0103175 [Dactylellina cionopaga]|nr:hypothetical protein ABW20_dc0103175 [Dactylellina cionopaga]
MKFSLGLAAAFSMTGYAIAAALAEPATSKPTPTVAFEVEGEGTGPGECMTMQNILVTKEILPTVTSYKKTSTATQLYDCSGCSMESKTATITKKLVGTSKFVAKTVIASKATTITVPMCSPSCRARYTQEIHITAQAATVTSYASTATEPTYISCGTCNGIDIDRMTWTTKFSVPAGVKIKTVKVKATTIYEPVCATPEEDEGGDGPTEEE